MSRGEDYDRCPAHGMKHCGGQRAGLSWKECISPPASYLRGHFPRGSRVTKAGGGRAFTISNRGNCCQGRLEQQQTRPKPRPAVAPGTDCVLACEAEPGACPRVLRVSYAPCTRRVLGRGAQIVRQDLGLVSRLPRRRAPPGRAGRCHLLFSITPRGDRRLPIFPGRMLRRPLSHSAWRGSHSPCVA